MIIYFALCLLINDYKKIYSRNVSIINFHTNCLCNGFSYILLLFKIISYYEKELCVCLETYEFCRYAFSVFHKSDEQKHCARNSKIRKYSFLVFEKSDEQTHCVRNFQIRKYAFLVFEKSDEQKSCVRNFKIRKYAFFNI